MKKYYCLSFTEFLEVNIQHSIRTRMLFPYIAYTCDDLCRIIRDYFQSFDKGCRIIRRAKFLEVRYYCGMVSSYCIYTQSAGNVSSQSQYKEKSQSISGTTRQPQSIFGKLSW